MWNDNIKFKAWLEGIFDGPLPPPPPPSPKKSPPASGYSELPELMRKAKELGLDFNDLLKAAREPDKPKPPPALNPDYMRVRRTMKGIQDRYNAQQKIPPS